MVIMMGNNGDVNSDERQFQIMVNNGCKSMLVNDGLNMVNSG